MQSEHCYRLWRKERRGGKAGLLRVGVVAGCGICCVVQSVGGDCGGGGVLLAWAGVQVCCPVCYPWCGVSGGRAWGARQTLVQRRAPGAWWRAVVGGRVLLTGLLLRRSGEDVERELHGN